MNRSSRSAEARADFRNREALRMVREPTPQEETLWAAIEPMGFEHQVSVFSTKYNKGWILDFFHPDKMLCVEADGCQHKASKDARRDRKIWNSLGIRTLRFRNSQIEKNLPQVLETIQRHL